MSKLEKIKKMLFIAIGFGLATYLIMSGTTILNKDTSSTQQEKLNEQNNS